MKKFLDFLLKPFRKFKSFYQNRDADNVYQLNGSVPLNKAFPIGLQHVLAMFVGNITPILLISSALALDSSTTSNIIQNAIFIAGIGTLLQLYPVYRFGAGLPIVVGISFTFLGVLTLVGVQYGYNAMVVSIIIGGLFTIIVGLLMKYIKKVISSLVSGVVVCGIGLSLLPVGIQNFFTYNNEISLASIGSLIALITFIAAILFQVFFKGYLKSLSVLFAILIGYVLALCFQQIQFDFSNVSIIDFPHLFNFSSLKKSDFNIGAILVVCVIYLVASTEALGDTSALCKVGLNSEATEKQITGAILSDGLVSAVSGCFGALPLTTFSQNVGLVATSKVINRFCIALGAIFLIIVGFFPSLAYILSTIPNYVLGGATMILFASIFVTGINMVTAGGMDERKLLILAIVFGLGYGITLFPEIFLNTTIINTQIDSFIDAIISNPVVNMFILAVILDLVIPKKKEVII